MSDIATVSTHAGFPNAAEDTRLSGLSLDALLVPQPRSTFFFTIEGDQWAAQGIFTGDIAVVDRALPHRPNALVIWVNGSDFALSPVHETPNGAEIWGVITAIIHRF